MITFFPFLKGMGKLNHFSVKDSLLRVGTRCTFSTFTPLILIVVLRFWAMEAYFMIRRFCVCRSVFTTNDIDDISGSIISALPLDAPTYSFVTHETVLSCSASNCRPRLDITTFCDKSGYSSLIVACQSVLGSCDNLYGNTYSKNIDSSKSSCHVELLHASQALSMALIRYSAFIVEMSYVASKLSGRIPCIESSKYLVRTLRLTLPVLT